MAEDKEVPLSELIETLNERFGTDFKEGERLFFESVEFQAKEDPTIRQRAQANSYEDFALSMARIKAKPAMARARVRAAEMKAALNLQ